MLCFPFFLHPVRIWSFLQGKPLPCPTEQVPSRTGTLAQLELQGITVRLLKEQSKCKFSARSSSFVALGLQTTALPPSVMCNLVPSVLHSPGAWDSLGEINPGVAESREMLPPPCRVPRMLPWPQQSFRCLNKRKIRPINVQQGFSDRLQQQTWPQDPSHWYGRPRHSHCSKVRHNPHRAGISAPNLSVNSRDEVQLHAHPSF